MRSLILIASFMCCILVLISMMNKVHEREVKESFSEQTRFSKKLLELEEEEEESTGDDNGATACVEEQVTFTDGCECETTKMAVFKVDKIERDQTIAVQFVDDVKMNTNAEVAGTLTINETPFATFDTASNKLIIG
jgi:hypothetical protein